MSKIPRFKGLRLLALPLLAVTVAVLVLTWGYSASNRAQADTVNGLMSLDVKSGGTCVDDKCDVPAGSSFTLSASIDSVPQAQAGPGYLAFQTVIVLEGVTYKPTAGLCEEIVHPDAAGICEREIFDNAPYTTIRHGDAMVDPDIPQVVQTVGNAVEITVNCTAGISTNKVSLVAFDWLLNMFGSLFMDADTTLVGAKIIGEQEVFLGPDPFPVVVPIADSLTINCVEAPPVGGISVDPEPGALPLEAAQSSGPSAGVLAGLIAGASAGAIALMGAAWYARKRWLA